jgi:glucose-6-phosphate 1-dehydrogenase
MNLTSLAALNEAKVEVRIQFKNTTQGIFNGQFFALDLPSSSETFKDIARNELIIRIQPSEAVYLKINAKTPGLQTRAMATEMDLTYNRRFADAKIPEAYEALILDALQGDHSNFVRHDELDVAWKVGAFYVLGQLASEFARRFSHQSYTGLTARAGRHRNRCRTRTGRVGPLN